MNFNSDKRVPPLPLATLADLHEGQSGVLSSLRLPQGTSEHLMWLGFVPGAKVTAGQSGPGGDPRVYTVSGTRFALRSDVARHMVIEPAEPRTDA